MSDWVCYLITSLDSNDTYIGSTNNFNKRLNNHNNNNPKIKRVGAKRTRGQTWIPLIIISGFENKISCLSFEAGWKRLSKTRSNNKLVLLNTISPIVLKYTKDTKWNRIIDLLYFTHNITYYGSKYVMNRNLNLPIFIPSKLYINSPHISIKNLPWPFFIN